MWLPPALGDMEALGIVSILLVAKEPAEMFWESSQIFPTATVLPPPLPLEVSCGHTLGCLHYIYVPCCFSLPELLKHA